MSGTIFSRKSRSYNCVEYELQSVLESSIFGWSCVFGLSSPSHVEGLPFPCHNIPEYIPSIARSCKITEMSELKSEKAVLLRRVWWSFWFAIKLFSNDKSLSPLQHVWDPGEHFGCHLRLSAVSGAHHQVASWLEVFVSFLLFANLLSSQRIAHNLDSFTDLPKQDQNALLKVDFSILYIHSFLWPNHNEILRKFFFCAGKCRPPGQFERRYLFWQQEEGGGPSAHIYGDRWVATFLITWRDIIIHILHIYCITYIIIYHMGPYRF